MSNDDNYSIMNGYDYEEHYDREGEYSAGDEYDEAINRRFPFQDLDLRLTRAAEDFLETSQSVTASLVKGIFSLFG